MYSRVTLYILTQLSLELIHHWSFEPIPKKQQEYLSHCIQYKFMISTLNENYTTPCLFIARGKYLLQFTALIYKTPSGSRVKILIASLNVQSLITTFTDFYYTAPWPLKIICKSHTICPWEPCMYATVCAIHAMPYHVNKKIWRVYWMRKCD